ncbi:MAG: hypothetical protein WA134_05510, partial [Rhodoferax sp.]|uniref:hypothetical protein n=1 Tax=Rhodoferax sp. TaxID=50421 RepID=UPI003BB4A142
YVPRNDGVICVIARRDSAVAIHAFGSHGLPRFARNDKPNPVIARSVSDVAIHDPSPVIARSASDVAIHVP